MECAICLHDRGNDEWHVLRCGHGFHKHCVFSWFAERRTCPTCRYAVRVGNLDWSTASCRVLTEHQANNLEARVSVRMNMHGGLLRSRHIRIQLEENRLVILKDTTTGYIVAIYSVEFLTDT